MGRMDSNDHPLVAPLWNAVDPTQGENWRERYLPAAAAGTWFLASLALFMLPFFGVTVVLDGGQVAFLTTMAGLGGIYVRHKGD